MSDGVIFVLVFGGLFVLRIIAATVVFLWILPRGDHCPNCDAVTIRLESSLWVRWIRSLRHSWCLTCGWHGMMRTGPVTPQHTESRELVK
jgi:hypothetical protein